MDRTRTVMQEDEFAGRIILEHIEKEATAPNGRMCRIIRCADLKVLVQYLSDGLHSEKGGYYAALFLYHNKELLGCPMFDYTTDVGHHAECEATLYRQ